MNYLFLTVVCLFVAEMSIGGEAASDHHAAIRQKCFAEYGLQHESGSAAYLANPKAKCYLKCFLEGNNLFHENGDLDTAGALNLVDVSIREQAKPLAQKCVSENSKIADRCEKSYGVMKCFYDGSPALFPQLGVFEAPHA